MSLLLPSNVRGPILDLVLPASLQPINIVVTNVTTGKSLELNLPRGWGGSDLSLNFRQQTIRDENGKDWSSLLNAANSSLWTPAPTIVGANQLKIEAGGGAVIATDAFEQTAGNLAGKTSGTGAKVYTAITSSDTDDFTMDTVNKLAQRTAVSDASADIGRGVSAGPANYAGFYAEVQQKRSKSVAGSIQGLIARATDLSNCVRLDSQWSAEGGGFANVVNRLIKRKAGITTLIKEVNLGAPVVELNLVTSSNLQITKAGVWTLVGSLGTYTGEDADLKTGGALASGKLGLYEAWPSATAGTRSFDNFLAFDLDGSEGYGATATLRWEKGYF